MKKIVLGLLFVAAAGIAQADESPDCENAATQQELNFCAAAEFDEADKQLNDEYRKAMAAVAATDKRLAESDPDSVGAVDALKKAQRGWIQYRDGQCELAGFEARGGSMEPMLVSGCLAEITRKRTAELREVAAQEEQ